MIKLRRGMVLGIVLIHQIALSFEQAPRRDDKAPVGQPESIQFRVVGSENSFSRIVRQIYTFPNVRKESHSIANELDSNSRKPISVIALTWNPISGRVDFNRSSLNLSTDRLRLEQIGEIPTLPFEILGNKSPFPSVEIFSTNNPRAEFSIRRTNPRSSCGLVEQTILRDGSARQVTIVSDVLHEHKLDFTGAGILSGSKQANFVCFSLLDNGRHDVIVATEVPLSIIYHTVSETPPLRGSSVSAVKQNSPSRSTKPSAPRVIVEKSEPKKESVSANPEDHFYEWLVMGCDPARSPELMQQIIHDDQHLELETKIKDICNAKMEPWKIQQEILQSRECFVEDSLEFDQCDSPLTESFELLIHRLWVIAPNQKNQKHLGIPLVSRLSIQRQLDSIGNVTLSVSGEIKTEKGSCWISQSQMVLEPFGVFNTPQASVRVPECYGNHLYVKSKRTTVYSEDVYVFITDPQDALVDWLTVSMNNYEKSMNVQQMDIERVKGLEGASKFSFGVQGSSQGQSYRTVEGPLYFRLISKVWETQESKSLKSKNIFSPLEEGSAPAPIELDMTFSLWPFGESLQGFYLQKKYFSQDQTELGMIYVRYNDF